MQELELTVVVLCFKERERLCLSFHSHLSTAVRASRAQQLHLLADRQGVAAISTAGKSFTQRFLTAVYEMPLDTAAEAKSLIKLCI